MFRHTFLVLLLFALGLSAAFAQITFAPAVNYPAGVDTRTVRLADVNGDGRPDLVVINPETGGNPGTVSILLASGAPGNFVAGATIAVGLLPIGVAVANFNGGGLDLAIANIDSGSVSILLGDGLGGFSASPGIAVPGAAAIVAADFNGDGRVDLAVARYDSNLSILLGNADGTFATRQDFPVTPVGLYFGIVAGDFNGDGNLDVAMNGPQDNRVVVLLGNGLGGFGAAQPFATGSGPLAIAAADFNGDGRLDLATANFNASSVSILLGNGDGTFGPVGTLPTGLNPGDITTADLDRDGSIDIVIASFGTNRVEVLKGNGNGTFAAPVTFLVGTGPGGVTVGDLDGDSHPDIVTANQVSRNVSVLLSTTPLAPLPPTGVTGTAGDAQATIAFTPPTDALSLPILDYTVTCRAGTSIVGSATGTASPIVVTGLINGLTHNCTVTARNANGTGAASLPASVTPKYASSIAISTSASPILVGEAVTFTATLSSTSGAPQLFGSVTFLADAAGIPGCISLVLLPEAQTPQCTTTFATAGTKVITASYDGIGATAPGSGTLAGGQAVTHVASSLALAASTSTPIVNASVTFTATVTGLSPTGTVIFRSDGAAITGCNPVTLAAGTAQCITSFGTAGAKVITADYSGDAANATSNGTLAGGVTVSQTGSTVVVTTSAPTVLLFAPVTYTATVTGSSPTGTVSFTDATSFGGPATALPGCTAVPLVASVAQCTMTYDATSAAVLAGLHFITASYSGDAANLPASATRLPPQIVDRTPSSTTLVSSAASVTTGTAVTFTATVGPFLPAGAIDFKDGGVSIAGCNAVLLAGDPVRTASCTTSFATPGTKVITAEFSGNGVQNGSTGTLAGGVVVTASQVTTFTGPTATGTGNATVSFTGGGSSCTFAPQGSGATQSAFFIPVTGHAKSPPAGSAPAGVDFPQGLLDFVLTGCTPGATVAFTVTYPTALPGGSRYWKYGPTPDNIAPHWYQLSATVSGNTATFSIIDGGIGDDDLTINGTVVDQGGPGSPGADGLRQVPTLSEWAMLLLALLMMTFAARRLGPRQANF